MPSFLFPVPSPNAANLTAHYDLATQRLVEASEWTRPQTYALSSHCDEEDREQLCACMKQQEQDQVVRFVPDSIGLAFATGKSSSSTSSGGLRMSPLAQAYLDETGGRIKDGEALKRVSDRLCSSTARLDAAKAFYKGDRSALESYEVVVHVSDSLAAPRELAQRLKREGVRSVLLVSSEKSAALEAVHAGCVAEGVRAAAVVPGDQDQAFCAMAYAGRLVPSSARTAEAAAEVVRLHGRRVD